MPIRENKFARRAREKKEEAKGVARGEGATPDGARRGPMGNDDCSPAAPEKDAREDHPDDNGDLATV